jgi:hypothetical protein
MLAYADVCRCAVGVIPFEHRAAPITWMLVSDSSLAKSYGTHFTCFTGTNVQILTQKALPARYFIADTEGGEVSRYTRWEGGQAGEGGVGGESLDMTLNISARDAAWLQELQVKVYQFRSGSRIAVVERPVNRWFSQYQFRSGSCPSLSV